MVSNCSFFKVTQTKGTSIIQTIHGVPFIVVQDKRAHSNNFIVEQPQVNVTLNQTKPVFENPSLFSGLPRVTVTHYLAAVTAKCWINTVESRFKEQEECQRHW